jgi:4-hydroxybenzoate polyprenyltransferase
MQPEFARTQGLATQLGGLLEAMRPAQWVKNGFVVAPLIFSSNLGHVPLLVRSALAAAAFCLAASGMYLWNDSLDWRADLVHPEKKNRPIPSGRLSPALAVSGGLVFLAAALAAGFSLGVACGVLAAIYVGLNLLYSTWLKHVAIIDLMCIAVGFVLRVMAGAEAIRVEASHWLLMCTFLLALFLGIAKRRQELVTLAADSGKHRSVLSNYSVPWLDQAGNLIAGAAVVSYALYAVAPETQARFHTDHLIYTLPFVVFGILRYLHLVHFGSRAGNPTSALLADRQLLGCVSLWVLACIAVIYL